MKPLAYKDFTIKAVVKNAERIESILIKLNARFVGTDHQKDTYFNIPTGKLKLRQGSIENLITHYERIENDGLEKTIVYQYDVNPDADQIANLFANYTVIGIVEKERKIFFIDTIKIHLDTLPDKKQYIEIEAIDSGNTETNEVLQERCLTIAEKLEIKKTDLLKTGYLNPLNQSL